MKDSKKNNPFRPSAKAVKKAKESQKATDEKLEAMADDAEKTSGERGPVPEPEPDFSFGEFIPEEYAEKVGDRFPYVGEMVHFTPKHDDRVARANRNPGPIAAIVTRVYSNINVDLKIIPNGGPMQDRYSVVRKDANPEHYFFDYIWND